MQRSTLLTINQIRENQNAPKSESPSLRNHDSWQHFRKTFWLQERRTLFSVFLEQATVQLKGRTIVDRPRGRNTSNGTMMLAVEWSGGARGRWELLGGGLIPRDYVSGLSRFVCHPDYYPDHSCPTHHSQPFFFGMLQGS